MNYKMMGRLFGLILCAESIFMLPSLILGLADGKGRVALGFGLTIQIGRASCRERVCQLV